MLSYRDVSKEGSDGMGERDLSGKSQPERTTLVSMSCSDRAPQLCVL